MKLTEPFKLLAMRVKHKPTEDDRERLGGVPRMDSEINRIRWHMHHDTSYMLRRSDGGETKESERIRNEQSAI